MRFLTPLGFLGLIAIAVLILIYILKPKYQEKVVSSTFVWKLSLKYKKQKMPFQWLKSSLILILQILVITIIAIMLTHPLVVLPTKSGEKIIILDASASMMAEQNGKTRFDRAVTDIGKLAERTTPDDKFTVIIANQQPRYVIHRSDSVSVIKQKLAAESCTLGQTNIDDSVKLAEAVLNQNPTAEIIFYTSRDYADSGSISVKNVSQNEWNASILNFNVKLQDGYYVFTAEVASFNKDAEIAVVINVAGQKSIKLAVCKDNKPTTIVWDDLNITEYNAAKVSLTAAEDSFTYDNEFYLYSKSEENFKVQLSSAAPGFLSAMLALNNCSVDIPTIEYPAKTKGYDLYIYEDEVPVTLPTDGAIWLISPATAPSSTGLTLGQKTSGNFKLSSSGGASDTYKTIMNNVTSSGISVTEYTKVLQYSGFEKLMMCGQDPVLLAKNENGVKTTALAFDIHHSNLPVIVDFPILITNLCNYSLARTIDNAVFNVGDSVNINAKPSAVDLTVTCGDTTKTFDPHLKATMQAEQIGAYTITQTLADQTKVVDKFYVRVAQSESDFSLAGATIKSPIVDDIYGSDDTVANDTMDIFVYLAAALIILLVVEWGVQYREQY